MAEFVPTSTEGLWWLRPRQDSGRGNAQMLAGLKFGADLRQQQIENNFRERQLDIQLQQAEALNGIRAAQLEIAGKRAEDAAHDAPLFQKFLEEVGSQSDPDNVANIPLPPFRTGQAANAASLAKARQQSALAGTAAMKQRGLDIADFNKRLSKVDPVWRSRIGYDGTDLPTPEQYGFLSEAEKEAQQVNIEGQVWTDKETGRRFVQFSKGSPKELTPTEVQDIETLPDGREVIRGTPILDEGGAVIGYARGGRVIPGTRPAQQANTVTPGQRADIFKFQIRELSLELYALEEKKKKTEADKARVAELRKQIGDKSDQLNALANPAAPQPIIAPIPRVQRAGTNDPGPSLQNTNAIPAPRETAEIPQVRNEEDYKLVPRGSKYVDPNGVTRTKP